MVTSRSGYAELTAEVRDLGLLRARTGYYVVLLAALLLALAAVVTALVLVGSSWWALLLAPALAVVSTQIAFFGHDATHREVTRHERPSRLLGMLAGNLLNGMSYGWWLSKHNAHHAHPNDLETDPDARAGVLVFAPHQATGRRGFSGWVTRHQAWLFLPMTGLEALNLHVRGVQSVLRPGLRHRTTESVLLLVHYVAYVGLLATVLTWSQALVFATVHQVVFGIYLGLSFAPGHKGMPVLGPEQAADPLLRQVLTSRNVRGGRLTELALGGLNYQIEHHLFPSMPRPNLHRAQRVVRSYCEVRGIAYAELSAVRTYATVAGHLDAVGHDLRVEARAA